MLLIPFPEEFTGSNYFQFLRFSSPSPPWALPTSFLVCPLLSSESKQIVMFLAWFFWITGQYLACLSSSASSQPLPLPSSPLLSAGTFSNATWAAHWIGVSLLLDSWPVSSTSRSRWVIFSTRRACSWISPFLVAPHTPLLWQSPLASASDDPHRSLRICRGDRQAFHLFISYLQRHSGINFWELRPYFWCFMPANYSASQEFYLGCMASKLLLSVGSFTPIPMALVGLSYHSSFTVDIAWTEPLPPL